MKDNLIFAHSVTCATLKKPYLMVVFLFFDPMLCFVCSPFRNTCSEGAVCVLFLNIYFFNMLSTCQKDKGQCLKSVDFFSGNNLYYTDFILIIINLCLYWRCVSYRGEVS